MRLGHVVFVEDELGFENVFFGDIAHYVLKPMQVCVSRVDLMEII